MDVREKLVELIQNSHKKCKAMKSCYECEQYGNSSDCVYLLMADEFITNGVTVQECGQWIYDFNLAGSNFYRCSVCDRQETLLEKEDIYEYCPFCHCGAKMMPEPPKGE